AAADSLRSAALAAEPQAVRRRPAIGGPMIRPMIRLNFVLVLALQGLLSATPTPTPPALPPEVRGHICQPGYGYDPSTGAYGRLPTPTRLPRPPSRTLKTCRNPP